MMVRTFCSHAIDIVTSLSLLSGCDKKAYVSAQAADEQRWQEKVDGILSNGVLSYKIRKAKVKD